MTLAPRRFHFPRPRFSLRTLLFVTLLIGSSGALWWNWGPWAPAYMLESPEPVIFSVMHGGRYIAWPFSIRSAYKTPDAQTHVREFATGREVYPDLPGNVLLHVSNNGRNLFTRTPAGKVRIQRIGSTESVEVPWHEMWSEHGMLRFLQDAEALDVFQSPEVMRKFKPVRHVAANEHWIAVDKRNSPENCITVYRTGENVPAYELKLEDCEPKLYPGGTKLFARYAGLFRNFVNVYDAASGTLLKSFSNDPYHPCFTDDTGRYVLEAGYEGSKVWQVEPEIKELGALPGMKSFNLTVHDGRIYNTCQLLCTDLFSGATIWSRAEYGIFSPDCRFALCRPPGGEVLLDGRTGRDVFHFSRLRWAKYLPPGDLIVDWSNDSAVFMTRPIMPNQGPFGPALYPCNRVTVWHPVRPLEWYGIAWLPEFWVTLLFAAGVLWSLLRDRRELNAEKVRI